METDPFGVPASLSAAFDNFEDISRSVHVAQPSHSQSAAGDDDVAVAGSFDVFYAHKKGSGKQIHEITQKAQQIRKTCMQGGRRRSFDNTKKDFPFLALAAGQSQGVLSASTRFILQGLRCVSSLNGKSISNSSLLLPSNSPSSFASQKFSKSSDWRFSVASLGCRLFVHAYDSNNRKHLHRAFEHLLSKDRENMNKELFNYVKTIVKGAAFQKVFHELSYLTNSGLLLVIQRTTQYLLSYFFGAGRNNIGAHHRTSHEWIALLASGIVSKLCFDLVFSKVNRLEKSLSFGERTKRAVSHSVVTLLGMSLFSSTIDSGFGCVLLGSVVGLVFYELENKTNEQHTSILDVICEMVKSAPTTLRKLFKRRSALSYDIGDVDIPDALACDLCLGLLNDPVVLCGHLYCNGCIEKYFATTNDSSLGPFKNKCSILHVERVDELDELVERYAILQGFMTE